MAIYRGEGGSIDGLVTPTTIPVTTSQGGTGATNANAGLNNLLPGQGGQSGKYLKSDGNNTTWDALDINTADMSGVVPLTKGGTDSTTASGARTNLGLAIGVDIPSNSGTGATGTWAVDISGNAATATDGLVSTGSYADPTWITSIAGSKVTGDITGSSGSVTNGVYTNGSYADPAFITSLAGSKVTGNISGNAANVTGTVALANGGTGATTSANALTNLLPSYTGNGGRVLAVNIGATGVEWSPAGSGSVTSVAMSVPTGLSVSGSPITTDGTLAVTYSSGYAIPTTAKQTEWDTAYGWGNHASAGYLTSYTETDPVFTASEAASITSTDTTNWDTAYGWGNHASAGYAADSAVVKLTGDQTVGGTKTFSSTITGSISGNAGTVTNGVYTSGDQTIGGTKTFSSTITGSISGNAGTVTNGVVTTGSYANPTWITSLAETKVLPSQTGNSGKYLTTNGTSSSWVTITANPALDDLSDVTITTPATDQVLKYNGTAWVNGAAPAGGQYFGSATVKAIAYNANTIGENVTVTTGNNGLSAGPVTISSGFTVTVQSGAAWVIV